MIYLTYLAAEDGTPIWHYVHPRIPDYILNTIAGKDHILIVNFLSAISMFGYDTLGSRLQVVEFENVKMTFRYINIGNKKLLAVALIDPKDNPRLIWKLFEKLVRTYEDEILKITPSDETIPEVSTVERISLLLTREFTKIIESRVRKINVLGRRDKKNLMVALALGLLFFFLTVGATYFLYKTYELLRPEKITLFFYTIVILNFIIPGIFIGFTTGYWKGALVNGIIVALIGLLTLTIIWLDPLTRAIIAVFSLSMETIILGILLVSAIIGAAMGLIAAFVAWFFIETRTLVQPP